LILMTTTRSADFMGQSSGPRRAADPLEVAVVAAIERISRRSWLHRPTIGVREPPLVTPCSSAYPLFLSSGAAWAAALSTHLARLLVGGGLGPQITNNDGPILYLESRCKRFLHSKKRLTCSSNFCAVRRNSELPNFFTLICKVIDSVQPPTSHWQIGIASGQDELA